MLFSSDFSSYQWDANYVFVMFIRLYERQDEQMKNFKIPIMFLLRENHGFAFDEQGWDMEKHSINGWCHYNAHFEPSTCK